MKMLDGFQSQCTKNPICVHAWMFRQNDMFCTSTDAILSSLKGFILMLCVVFETPPNKKVLEKNMKKQCKNNMFPNCVGNIVFKKINYL